MSSGDENRTVIIEKDGGAEVGAFLLGALVGAGLALLFAPRTGEDTQKRLRERARKIRDITGDTVRGVREDLGTRVGAAREFVDQGRQVAAGARADLEAKLERSKAAVRAGVEAAQKVAGETAQPAREDGGGEASEGDDGIQAGGRALR